jgi:hypothetical protein
VTLPVKETKSTLGCSTTYVKSFGERWITWIAAGGTPARVNAKAKRSAVRGVCGEGLRITEFPAMRAGKTELIVTKYGKLEDGGRQRN